MEGIAAASSILQVIFSVTKVVKELNEVRESYSGVALNSTLVASQLSTIRAALEALHDWRSNDQEITGHSRQLDKDLEVSLSCCAILITVIDGKLGEAGYKPGVKQKIKYLWLEDILKEYLSNLEGQVRALQLLLTIYQCKTATEKTQKLARAESRRIIENVRAKTQTLRSDNKDFQDAASVLSLDPSIHFDFDCVLMKTPAYIHVYGERPSRQNPPPVPDRSLKPSDWKRTSIWNPYLGQEVDVGTLSSKDSGGHGGLPVQQIDEGSLEQSSTKRQGQQAASIIEGALRDTEETSDGQFTGVSGPSEDGRDATMHSAVEDLVAAGGLEPLPIAALTEQRDNISPSAAGNPTIAPCSSSPAEPNMTEERDDERTPSSGHSAPTLSVLRQARSDHTKKNDSDTTSSVLDDPEHGVDIAVETKRPSKQVNNIPRVFYGPNKITEISMYQDTYIELDAGTPTSSFRIPKVQRQDLDSVSEQEGFKTLSTKIEIVSEVPRPPQQAEPFATDSTPTNKSKEAARSSASNTGLSKSVNRIGSTGSVTGDIDMNVSANPENDLLPLPIPDGTVEAVLQISETSSDEVRRENLSLTSLDVLATGAGLEVPQSSDQLDKRTSDGSNVTPLSGFGLTIVDDPYMRDGSLQLDTSDLNTLELSSSFPPQRRPPVPPRSLVPSTFSQLSSLASQVPLTPTSSTTGTDLYTFSKSSRDSCVTGSSSCPSSSDLPEVNTADNIQYYTDNCTATSSGIELPLTLQEQGQIQLRNLRTQLEAAKARGDPKSQEDAVQKSIDVIRRTQLSSRAEPAITQMTKQRAPSLKPKKKTSMIRFSLSTSSTRNEALGQAAADGDKPTLTRLLSENVHVNCTSLDSKTPMMRAAKNGHVQCLSILRASGADEFAVDKSGATALHHAILSNQIPAANWLLKTYPQSEVVRHRSFMRSRPDGSNRGPSQRILREIPDATGLRPLHIAVERDMGGMVQTLLAAGADMEAKNKQGRTPLIHAIITSRRDSFNTLLRRGARIDQKDAMRMSALHWAASLGQVATITTLLEKGVSRLDHDVAGHEPIHHAAASGHIPAVEALITEGSDLDRPTKNADNSNGESLLHIASLYNHLDLARYLLENGVQVNYWSDRRSMWASNPRAKLLGSSLTPLHYACCLGHFEMAALLLDHNALVNAATVDGYAPLMMAVEAENTDLVSLLLSRGAKVNASLPGTLSTALHMAARRGDIETVRELCRAGADFRARAGKDSYKRTPLQTCGDCDDKKKRSEVLDYLSIVLHNDAIKRGLTNPQHVNFQPQTPLVQQARNPTYYQQPAPPPPYSKAPPAWG